MGHRPVVHWDDLGSLDGGSAAVRPDAPVLPDLLRMNKELLHRQQQSIRALEELDKQLTETVEDLDRKAGYARSSTSYPSALREDSMMLDPEKYVPQARAPSTRDPPVPVPPGAYGASYASRERSPCPVVPEGIPPATSPTVLIEITEEEVPEPVAYLTPVSIPAAPPAVVTRARIVTPTVAPTSPSLADICKDISSSMNALRYHILEPSQNEPDLTTMQLQQVQDQARGAVSASHNVPNVTVYKNYPTFS
eukprot:TRINITY_DN10179_c0_g1_i2.p1 TRINITY_DN10179_c0_g1~~TRINITY_DN10179_c0_g1_i2.p1  ORF type:complete len:251 (+),score=55.25 TRINITY_DN10179_c0_g1_i2:61-813(+)